MKMLVPVPEKKGKEPKGGPCCRGPSDAMSGETEIASSLEGDEDEEEEEEVESDPLPSQVEEEEEDGLQRPGGGGAKEG